MYERSAVILERYFAEKFNYNEKGNLKDNYENYCKLMEELEQYQKASIAEDGIIKTCEDAVSKIKQIQSKQSALYRKAVKLQEDRNSLFEDIGESTENIEKTLNKIEKDIDKNSEEMKPIDAEFTKIIEVFNQKSEIRSKCGRDRKKIEKKYREILETTINNFQEIDNEEVKEIKSYLFSEEDTTDDELRDKMVKNGENEKIPFDLDVIENAIKVGQDIHKREAKLLIDIYEKTNGVLNEISGNVVRVQKYKKVAKNTRSKLEFIKSEKEYLIQFLDNERVSVSLGKKEHKKLMKEACQDLVADLEQINNLYEILLKETEARATQKMYKETYNIEYLKELEEKEKEFDKKVKELNLVGKIVNPIYWRIDGIKKIYATFDKIVTQEYGRDLTKFKKEEVKKAELVKEEIVEEFKSVPKTEDDTTQEIIEKQKKELITNQNLEQVSKESKEVPKALKTKNTKNDRTKKVEENNNKTDDWDDEDDDDYEDIDTLLKKRKEKLKKGQTTKKVKHSKKGGLFGKFTNKD